MNDFYSGNKGQFLVLALLISGFVQLYAAQRESTAWGVKTNVLYWTGLTPEFKHTAFTPNISFEYFISQQWSLQASAMYAHWDYGDSGTFWGVSGYMMEPRFWLKDNHNAGLYMGAFGQLGDYDVRNRSKTANSTRQTENYTGKYWLAGVSVGYYWAIYKGLGIETGVRVGYRHSNAREYEWSNPDKFYIGEKNANKWGVTEWNISLAYRF